jgi:AmmeMemoRadiSam system protein B
MIRELKFNGLWYPSDKGELLKLTKSSPKTDNKDIFGVVPHAGLYYSSSLIKLFFDTLKPDINKIILLTPSHYFSLKDNKIISGNFDYYKTNFNTIEGFALDIFEQGGERVTINEHAVEMVLPYIGQRKNIKLCCAHVNRFTDVEKASDYAKELLSVIDDKTAVIASSDFTHYGPNFNYTPFGNIIDSSLVDKVKEYDRNIATLFVNGEGCLAYNKYAIKNKATICGIAAILIVSELARLKKMKGKILDQSTSIKNTSYDNNFVSYISLAWRE